MPVLRHLKHNTGDLHAAAEEHVRILDPDVTVAAYRRYLERMYGFHGAIERIFGGRDDLRERGFDPDGRRKLPWLAADLSALGADPASLPLADVVIPSFAAAIGAAYVLEGSTLGGRYILAHLGGELRPWIGVATRFLEGYRDETGARWRAFAATAEALPPDDVAEATDAARATFAALIEWLDEPARPSPHPVFSAAR